MPATRSPTGQYVRTRMPWAAIAACSGSPSPRRTCSSRSASCAAREPVVGDRVRDGAQVVRRDRDADQRPRVEQPARQQLEVRVGVGLDVEHRRAPAVLGGLDELVVPVGALDEPDRQRRRALRLALEARGSCRASPASRAGSPAARARRTARRGTPPRRAARGSAPARRRASPSTPCRCAGARRPRSRVAAAAAAGRRRRACRAPGASGRSSGVSADTFTHRFARASTPALSDSSWRPRGPRPRGVGDRVQRLGAAVGVALRLGLRHRRLAEQVDGGRDAVLPQVAQVAERRLRRLADDEAVRHVLDARRPRPGPARAAPPWSCPSSSPPRSAAAARSTSSRKRGQMAREVVEVARRGHDVDEAEQRGLELGVRRGEVHRLVVDRLQRVAGGRKRAGEPLAHLEQFALQRRSVDRP